MSATDPGFSPTDCIFDLVFSYMLPIFTVSAGGDIDLARRSIIDLLDAYEACTAAELELVARIVSFSHAAIDSLRQAARADLSATLVLRFRANAVALNRSAETCRKTLESMQDRRRAAEALQVVQPIPQAPLPAGPATPKPPHPPAQPVPAPPAPVLEPHFDLAYGDVAAMQRQARALLADIQSRVSDAESSSPPPEVPSNMVLFGHNGFRPEVPAR
ncbi:MAG TPA: hypothetical protein PLD10_13835 [Rhodopila sp.]|nr:hypothetical protein [Rhodopila sp.]